jgi:DNA polymerase-4
MPYPSDRYVALIDLDAFFASVEVVEHPELKGKPLLIGGSPSGRGVVAAASYEARRFGAHSAMPMAQALRLCPQATVLPARHSLYHDYSQRVMVILGMATPLLEQVSVDEAYLELTPVVPDLMRAETVVRDLQARVRAEVGLPCSAGVAQNKLVAKVACETGKPNGLVVVAPGTEAAFLSGLPVQRLPGIGPRTAERLNAEGFTTLGQIASAPVNRLTALMGPWGGVLQRRAQGQDQSPVHTDRETKSISAETTFPSDIGQLEPLAGYLQHMAAEVAESARRQELVARTVTLKLRFADFTTITRSMSRPSATASAEAVLETARRLLEANWAPGQAVRLIGVGLSNLRPRQTPGQLALQDALNPSTIP